MILSASGGTESGEKSLDRVIENISRYLLVTSKTIPEALLHNAKEIAEALYILTPRADATVIDEKVRSLQGRFIRAPYRFAQKFKGGRQQDRHSEEIRRVRSRMFSALKIHRYGKETRDAALKREVARSPETARLYKQYKRLTMAEEAAAAIAFRTAHIGAMASSWRPALRALGSKMRAAAKEKRIKMRPQSFVEISEDGLTITITNEMNGIVKLAAASGFTSAALDARSYDIEQHIAEKMGEALQAFVKPV